MIILKILKREEYFYYRFLDIIDWCGDIKISIVGNKFGSKTAAISIIDICKTIRDGSSSFDMSRFEEEDKRYLFFILQYLFEEMKVQYL